MANCTLKLSHLAFRIRICRRAFHRITSSPKIGSRSFKNEVKHLSTFSLPLLQQTSSEIAEKHAAHHASNVIANQVDPESLQQNEAKLPKMKTKKKEKANDEILADEEIVKERIAKHPVLMAERYRIRDQKKLRLYLQSLVCCEKLDIHEACRIIKSLKTSNFGMKVSGPEVSALIIQGVCRFVRNNPSRVSDKTGLEYKLLVPKTIKNQLQQSFQDLPPPSWGHGPTVSGPFASIYWFVDNVSKGVTTPTLAISILQYCSMLINDVGLSNWNIDVFPLIRTVLSWLEENHLDINDPSPLFHLIYLKSEEKAEILELLHRANRDFDSVPEHPNLEKSITYENSLLGKLNKSVEEDYALPSGGLFDKETMENNLCIQLENEKRGYVDVVLTGHSYNDPVPEMWKGQWEQQIIEGLQQLKEHHHALPRGKHAELQSYLYILEPDTIAKILVEHLCRIIEGQNYHESGEEAFPTLTYAVAKQIIGLCQAKMRDKRGYSELIKRVCKSYYDIFLDPEAARSTDGNYGLFWRKSGIEEIDFDPDNFYNEYVRDFPPFIHVGIELMDLLINCTTIDSIHPRTGVKKSLPCLFKELTKPDSFRKTKKDVMEMYIVRALPRLSNKFCRNSIAFDTCELPMIVPPVPWTSSRRGCFHLLDVDLIRTIPQWGEWMNKDIDDQRLEAVYDSLNQLSATPWIVNKEVLSVANALFDDSSKSELEYHTWKNYFDNLALPRPAKIIKYGPSPLNKALFRFSEKADGLVDKEAKSAAMRQHYQEFKHEYGVDVIRSEWKTYLDGKKDKANNNSQWYTTLYKLAIAQHYQHQHLWFPHNMDFRGRVYPTSAIFQYMSEDLTRSLFLFAKGKPLGQKGLDWLKIHCINLTGLKKRSSNADRLAYANEILDDILTSGRSSYPNIDANKKPPSFESLPWWMQSEEPWQTLACCIELYKAYKLDDPTTYISHLPIHQDGSCNGLQHYSALGRDYGGGKEVNLVPQDKPGDVYARIAEGVEKIRQFDENKPDSEALSYSIFRPHKKSAVSETDGLSSESESTEVVEKDIEDELKGEYYTDKDIAQLLVKNGQSWVQRKVVKQTVMTSVYGVTKYGARNQIRRKLKDLNKELNKVDQLTSKEIIACAKYLADKVFDALEQEFPVTRKIQTWFVDCTGKLTGRYGQAAQWMTPLGLNAIQPYWKIRGTNQTSKELFTSETNYKNENEDDKKRYDWPLGRKQKNAFPPNYIHSLDSTHMMMTSLHLHHLGITFAAVHDCYWTHGCDVDVMNNVLREQFVSLHKLPLLEELRDHFIHIVPEIQNQLITLPEKGRLDLEGVLKSEYFFS